MKTEMTGHGRFEHESHAKGARNLARALRRSMTVGEKLLWNELRQLGHNFRRQAPMGGYVADFISHSARLVIEVDGPWHDFPDRIAGDEARDAWFESQGYQTLRFQTSDVHDCMDDIILTIKHHLAPLPLDGEGVGGRGVYPAPGEDARSAPIASLNSSTAPTPPSPALPPSRGKGGATLPARTAAAEKCEDRS